MSLISFICTNHNDPQLAEFSPQKRWDLVRESCQKSIGVRVSESLEICLGQLPPQKTNESSPKKGIIYIKDMNHFPTIKLPNQHGTFFQPYHFSGHFSNQIT